MTNNRMTIRQIAEADHDCPEEIGTMSETKRIDWTSDESVVRAAVPDVSCWSHGNYHDGEQFWVVYATKFADKESVRLGGSLEKENAWALARNHPSVVALDEAHRKVMEKWPDAFAANITNGNMWMIQRKSLEPLGPGLTGWDNSTEAEAWLCAAKRLDAASKLEGPSVQGESKESAIITDHYFDTMGLDIPLCAMCGRIEAHHLNRQSTAAHQTGKPIPAPREEEGAGVRKFTKRPVTIEALLLDNATTPSAAAAWCGGRACGVGDLGAKQWIEIDTLEGTMRASFGDYIIKGVKGEFYPCKPDIFEASYSPAALVVEEAPRQREGFDPEKVIRADTEFPDENGKWWQASCVEAEDFDALMAMYKSLRGFSHLEEALDRKVTWRVEQRVGQAPEYEWVRVVVSEDRTIFNPYHSRQHSFRLVKITTTEEVIEVRTKESADGK